MFFFGIFSTHLPYLVLLVLYALGLGAYAANKLQNVSPEPEAKVIQFKSNQVQTPASVYYFINHKSEKEKQVKQDISIGCLSIQHSAILKHKIESECFHFISNSLEFNLFSRPPPFCLI